MATQIQNTKTSSVLREAYGLGPLQIPNSATPVINCNPRDYYDTDYFANVGQSTSGTITGITFDSDKETYITNINLSYAKDASCDVSSIQLSLTVGGAAKPLIRVALIALTAQHDSINLILNRPIKVDKGTSIAITGTFTAGALSRVITLQGYQIAPSQTL